MNKVEITNLGIPHFNAWCHSCDWCYQDYLDLPKGYREIRKHVAKTGHTVDAERGLVTRYAPIHDDNPNKKGLL